jgi:serine/threonine protein kinase
LPLEPKKLARLLSVGTEGQGQAETDGPAPETEAIALPPGTILDDFEILEEIGRGGMGVVYRALERSLRRVVALKVLSPQISENASLAKRFRREAVLAANLTHPNIVPVYTVDKADPPRYFTMEFVQGRSLREKVRSEGFLKPSQAVRIALQACEAIHYAHEHDILHRDIKPANILLQNHVERVRITDFGIAQDVTGRLAEKTETTGMSAGTPAFMSPEQNLGRALDKRTDVFSLGMTLYYMLTGEVAYHARNRAELALAFQQQSPAPPSRLNPDVTPDLDSVVLKMIAAEQDHRYADCWAAAEALRAAARSEGLPLAPDVRHARVPRASRWVVAILGTVVLAAVVVFAWRALLPADTGRQPSETPPIPSSPPPPTSPGSIVYLKEFPATFTGWSHAPTAGQFVSDGQVIFPKGIENGGIAVAEKRLEHPLEPLADFHIQVDMTAGQDAEGRAGWLRVSLLDEAGEIVAEILWKDSQAASGYGEVGFYAEGGSRIYHSTPPGSAREYPSPSAILKLSRTGDQWAAYVGDAQKGSLVTVASQRTATRIRLSAGGGPSLVPRAIRIESIYVVGTRDTRPPVG